MSLRLRLTLLVVSLVAIGLVVSDVVTYMSLRSFLLLRVDQQLHEALGPVSRAVMLSAGQGGETVTEGLPTDQEGSAVLPAGPAPSPQLPPGTYGELRAADGSVLGRVELTYGSTATDPPTLPADLPAVESRGALTEPITVEGDGADYRVLALSSPGRAGTLVVAIPLTEVTQTLRRLGLLELVLTCGLLLALAGLSWWMVHRSLRPLERMGEATGAIAEGDLTRRVEDTDPRTEVGRLGLAFNAMLVQIEGAFAERLASEEQLRRFLADASHELRTPLTSIRGYAELFRRGAERHPEDLHVSMRRIEQEAARMGVLVEDMLLLARLDQSRPLAAADVDLATIAADAVQDARTADPTRAIILSAAGPAVVSGDEDRLRQVVSNLVMNALAHTPAGSEVDVQVEDRDGMAVLSVSDRGSGLSPEEAERVFEPFYRADPARTRDKGGAGLGLSIVAAITAVHGGSVEVVPREGGGSVFRVSLPMGGC